MTRLALRLTAALVAAVFLWLVVTLPPAPAAAVGTVADAIRARTIAGAFHIHSVRSDGAGDRDAIAAAAARAGLQFVILTDHGDATRTPDPPAYLHNVLCVDAVEVSTNGGHLVALDMPPAPYPLGGDADAVVEDVIRLGGMPIAAHPDSPKTELAWTDWTTPVAGLEWLSLDSAWRDKSTSRLARVAFDSLMRPGPALASLLDRPVTAIARWDAAGMTRRVVGLAGHDAHGGLGRQTEEGRRWSVPGVGSYEASFRAFSSRVIVREKLTGDASLDAKQILAAIRAGRLFASIDGIAAPAFVDFHALEAGVEIPMGEERPFVPDLRLTLRTTAPTETTAVLLRDGADVASFGRSEIEFRPTQPGAYRVELRRAGSRVPWVVTNPIYLRGPVATTATDERLPDVTVLELAEPGTIEKDPQSSASISPGLDTRTLSFRLRPGERASQYAALAIPLPQNLSDFDSIVFDGRSKGPMRVSVQLRFENAGGSRWRRSVFLSSEPAAIAVAVDRLLAADRPGPVPPARDASSLLFVVDLTNALPGAEGEFEISRLRLTRKPSR